MVRTSGQNVHIFPVTCAWLAEAPSVHFNRGFIFTLPPEIIPTLQSEQGRAVLKDILRTCMEITVISPFTQPLNSLAFVGCRLKEVLLDIKWRCRVWIGQNGRCGLRLAQTGEQFTMGRMIAILRRRDQFWSEGGRRHPNAVQSITEYRCTRHAKVKGQAEDPCIASH